MTLVEMVVASLLLGCGLFLLVGWSRTQRQDARERLARRVLAELDRAWLDYRRATGTDPPGLPNNPDEAFVALLRHPAGAPLAAAVPDGLWTATRPRRLLDPWGTPLRCVCDPREPLVRGNGGRPVFISAGADRDFGDGDSMRTGDNLRSDDPGADGFRDAPPVDGPGAAEDDEGVNPRGGRACDAQAHDRPGRRHR